MKKVLYCASTVSHIKNFHLPYLKAFREANYQVWVGVNEKKEIPFSDFVVPFSFRKKMLSLANLIAILSVWKLLRREKFDIVSIHTTLASIIVRLAIKLLPKTKRPRVFHTSHGYLFDDNSRFKKLLYLIPEKLCSSVTNVLMVMNQEDLSIAKKYRLYKNDLYLINGMGINPANFFSSTEEEKRTLRQKMGYEKNDFLFIYIAEFSKRKNHLFLIRAFSALFAENKNIKLMLVGDGTELGLCKEWVTEAGYGENIYFAGFVENVRELLDICDAYVSSSLIEGLPFNIMEAMLCNKPVVASRIKGHIELIDDAVNGFLYKPGKTEDLCAKLRTIVKISSKITPQLKLYNNEKLNKYGKDKVVPSIMKIYRI
jgi:glycosyltransferase involved in cell wall biosynthesis